MDTTRGIGATKRRARARVLESIASHRCIFTRYVVVIEFSSEYALYVSFLVALDGGKGARGIGPYEDGAVC